MTRFYFLLWLIAILFACKPGVPKDIIQPEIMEKVLFDIHIADAYSSNLPGADSAKKVISPIYKGIYQKFGTDSAAFAKSKEYYYHHPDLLSKMYNTISERLKKDKEKEDERLRKEAEKAQKAQALADSMKLKNELKKKQDSIKTLKSDTNKLKKVNTSNSKFPKRKFNKKKIIKLVD